MLGTDFIKHFGKTFEILALDRNNGDITNRTSMEELIKKTTPDIIVNFAAYTNVEAAEDT
jgi:dTDP-4-dehydrorhamnose reductase